ncbi:MAG TPA: peptidoglycan DD-metalloendopeptidase family protein [Chitinophagaceae bacterium]|nr:peptidoglycan DD-metalloendopeptidase family protein [Chitinophagaceae bacterium]
MKFFLTAVLLATISMTAVAQSGKSRTDLERERSEIQQEIDRVRRSLDETKKNKKETLGQLALLQRKLRLREQAIRNINDQINVIQSEMNQSWRDILRLRRELDTLKLQYEKTVVYAYKNRSNYDFLNFIFSATNYNDALKRVAYLKSYRAYRQQQAANIAIAQAQLNQRLAGLKVNREQKSMVLKEESKQRSELFSEKKEKDAVVSKLRSREKELSKDLANKQKQDRKIKDAITAAIRREIDAEKKRQAALAAATPKTNASSPNTSNTDANVNKPAAKPKSISVFDDNPTEKLVSDNFEKNKNKLPWPVESGNVSMEFGLQKVLDGSGITYNNQGITIETKVGVPVKSVFDGEVSSVFSVGDVVCVIVRHGKYFTSYSGLSSASVSKGQEVKVGQTLGRMSEKTDGMGELEFIIMNDKMTNLNPRQWLR